MDNRGRLKGLDGLRAVFCIAIVIYHVNLSFDSVFSPWLDPIYSYGGYFGNYMFFILSGFLTAYHYKKKIIDKSCRIHTFFGKKLLKLYPVYFCSNLAVLLLDTDRFTIKKTLSTLLMISNGWFDGTDTPYNHPAWFVCILMICYVLYCITCMLAQRSSVLYPPVCCFMVFWGMFLEKADWNLPLHYRTCGEGYLNFFLGVLLFELLMTDRISKKRILTAAYAGAGLSAVLMVLSVSGGAPGDMRWWISALCACILSLAVYEEHLIRLLSLPLLQRAGKFSLSVYFWHVPAVRCFIRLKEKTGFPAADQRVNFCFYFLFLGLIAILSFYSLEKPFYNFKHAERSTDDSDETFIFREGSAEADHSSDF